MSDVAPANLPAIAKPPFSKDETSTMPTRDESDKSKKTFPAAIPRSASYTQLPSSDDAVYESNGIKRTLSEINLASANLPVQGEPAFTQGSDEGIVVGEVRRSKSLVKRKSFSRLNPKITISKFTLNTDKSTDDLAYEPRSRAVAGKADGEGRARTVSGSLFARRKSWIASSRSPSPNEKELVSAEVDGPIGSRDRSQDSRSPNSKTRSKAEQFTPTGGKGGLSNGTAAAPSRKGTILQRKSRRPLSAILGKSSDESASPAVPSIPKSYSTDRLPSLIYDQSSSEKLPAVSRSQSSEQLDSMCLESPRKRDELWNNFRNLDSEFQKFQSKPSTLKTNAIRTVLLPFLRAYAEHPSNKILRAEDLDRRANIFNKWWTGLLEMLNGRNGQSVSGNDRPAVLEGVTAIMIRPEWRIPYLPAAARSMKVARPSLKSRSTTSLESTASEFLAESVFHNVRNMFTQNLLAQMAFVVDRLSLRSVAASVVTFCGKAAAYAFFFCPGVAEILIRLWAPSSDLLQRVLGEIDVPRNTDLRLVAEKVAPLFPQHLHSLTVKSLSLTMRHLRSRSQIPLSTAYIPWHGPWIGRWAGRDSDLFFVFSKLYHVLLSEFLPQDSTTRQRACAPGYIMVQAQMLTVLDATIHRAPGPPPPESLEGLSSMTFDDVLAEADASATALPVPPANIARSMAENRLIRLLREFLSETTGVIEKARKIFAESFGAVLKAAARRTSLFDHNACFTLCDFLEEAITILARYFHNTENPIDFPDWPFWLNVCQQMLVSNNSMTEIRLYAFLYSLWGNITSDDLRKQDLCLDWLLSEGHFQKQFNHWCPMVRAYFMRLLCWRLARFDGEASELDATVYETLSTRLKDTWSHYIFIQENAKIRGSIPVSTAPCSPAPGRRLVIVRTDVQPAGDIFLSFDGIVPQSTVQPTAYEKYASLNSLSQSPISSKLPNGQERRSSSPARKGWGMLKQIMPFTTASTERSKDGTSPSRSSTSASSNGTISSTSPQRKKLLGDKEVSSDEKQTGKQEVASHPSTHSAPKHQHHAFKFSLEWSDKPTNTPKEKQLYPPRLPLSAQMLLQSRRAEPYEYRPKKPEGEAAGPSRYAGRALAEWATIVVECQNFFDRRKFEGVPGNKWVETPTLGVESFRKPG